MRGVDLEAWGQRHAPWYHFGQLTADHTRFVVDKRAITETLHHASRDRACRWCPAFAWPAVNEGNMRDTQADVSRITFSVPVCWPVVEIEKNSN